MVNARPAGFEGIHFEKVNLREVAFLLLLSSFIIRFIFYFMCEDEKADHLREEFI